MMSLVMERYVSTDFYYSNLTDDLKFSSVSYNQVVGPPPTRRLEVGGQNSANNLKENVHASMPVVSLSFSIGLLSILSAH